MLFLSSAIRRTIGTASKIAEIAIVLPPYCGENIITN